MGVISQVESASEYCEIAEQYIVNHWCRCDVGPENYDQ